MYETADPFRYDTLPDAGAPLTPGPINTLRVWLSVGGAVVSVPLHAATTNAGEMISTLTLNMNRVRQASITKEIIEVVSGALALE